MKKLFLSSLFLLLGSILGAEPGEYNKDYSPEKVQKIVNDRTLGGVKVLAEYSSGGGASVSSPNTWTANQTFQGANGTTPVCIVDSADANHKLCFGPVAGYFAITGGSTSPSTVIWTPGNATANWDFNNSGNTITIFEINTASNRTVLASATIVGWAASAGGGGTPDTGFGRGGTTGSIRVNPGIGTVPTISSGFGTSPSVTAGGSNSLFQVNVGTGGTATSGIVAFNGTWTNAPYCFVNDEGTSAGKSKGVATATQVTLTTTTAWSASSLLDVFCVSQ